MKRVACIILCVALAGCSGISGIGAETPASGDQQVIEPTSTPDEQTVDAAQTATESSDTGESSSEPIAQQNQTGATESGESPTDSDGDGLTDEREQEIGTDPQRADTDGDGLNDSVELDSGTSPVRADTDNDSLNDSLEQRYGTDPTDADTDGDTLKDGWEVHNKASNGTALPGADPLRKDIYVQVSYADGTRSLEQRQVNRIKGAFNRMDVSNPDGSTGISVHIRDRYNRVPITQTYSNRSKAIIDARQSSTSEQMQNRAGLYHHVILMDISDEAGFEVVALESDRIVIVDGNELGARGGGMQYRVRMVIWGLVRNIAGDVTAPYEGWWAQETHYLWSQTYLPDPVIEKIEQDGFMNETEDAG